MVSGERDLNIEWQQFSLALKNDELGGEDHTGSGEVHRAAHRIHRVILAAARHGASLIDLYTAFGIPYHIGGEKFDDELIAKVLEQRKLPPELAKAADDKSLDDQLQASTDEAVAIVGKDIGVPTIVFEAADGQKLGYFGPVLRALPDKADALELWDGLSRLASKPNFYELKRPRSDDGPDVFSTAKC